MSEAAARDSAGSADDARTARGRRRTGGRVGVHRPRRALVAIVELLLVALAIWAAVAAWSHGTETIDPGSTIAGVDSFTRYHGGWIATAVGLATAAAVLVLDAARQLVLAIGPRHR
ncbi:hypothetical protein [Haloechinothrix sp. LS1_15]|uniref:hypothetical protein n=1 Tax=Haloechinothrix sp. LS1_15 TaxID=2652248 RepID=UPI0029468D1D|nr:hypothetical protein [Haloechinothrix sp. LS1_15]MDV6012637.1 hypothetical protein [Haloechinothrix sp. LS1_15]